VDTSTRLPGHGLLSEGKPYEWRRGDEEDAPSWHPARYYGVGRWASSGCGICSCGAASPPLESDGARKRWHRVHKDEIRASVQAAG
jgi:hypothetical protein